MAESDKKKDILKAAGHCFAHFGFSKTTMDDIGRMVGLNKASLYYYYKNKEAIFCEIIEAEGERFLASLLETIAATPRWDEKIMTYLVLRQRYFQESANLHNLSLKTAEQLKFQPMFRSLASRFADREAGMIAEILDCAMADGQIRQTDTRRTAAALLSVANRIKNEQVRPSDFTSTAPDTGAVEDDIRFIVTLILDGLNPNVASPKDRS